jgi:hypothetical protein
MRAADVEEGVKVIKLTSGDTLVASIVLLQHEGPFVIIKDPIQFNMQQTGPNSGTMLASKWLETDETQFKVSRFHIVATADPNEMLKEYYYSSLDDLAELAIEDEDDEMSLLHNFETPIKH